MNVPIVFYFMGWILMCEGSLMVLPLGVSLFYGEPMAFRAFLITMSICLVLGGGLIYKKPKNSVFYMREGLVITALSWIVISVIGALPFLFSRTITNPVAALFETVSGFTTTGASILPEVESLPRGILFWRSFTHWIGGMGVLVFILMLKPLSGGSNMNLIRAESTGPQVEKMVPKVQANARILYYMYIALTLLQILFLLAGRMPLFDAVTTAFGTAGTGGFGIKNDSMASYSPYIQNVVSVFMMLFGVTFAFYFLILQRRLRRAFGIEEVRWYIGVILVCTVIIACNIRNLYPTAGDTLRHAFFQVSSIITTTGFATTDFNRWPEASRTILVLLMFVGACAGSTGGGIKISRALILGKTVREEIHHFLHSQSVGKISIDNKTVPHEVVRAVNVYMAAYVLIFAVSLLLISFNNFDFATNFTAVAATLNNIGPGLELVGPTHNFSLYSNGAQLVMIFDMLAGRLELFPILLLFSKSTWRRF